jgi:hypothetical protein
MTHDPTPTAGSSMQIYRRCVRCAVRHYVLVPVFVLLSWMPAGWAIDIIPGSERTNNGHRYALLETGSWTSSQAAAVALGGTLVTVNDAAENDFIFDTYANFDGASRTLWIGLRYVDDGDGINEPQPGGGGVVGTDDWQWVSGEQAVYRTWWPADPNGFGGESYVAIVPPAQNPVSKQWFDADDSGSGYNVYGVVEFTPTVGSLDIRRSGDAVELSLATDSNTTYQVQFTNDLLSKRWSDLGAPILGDGFTKTLTDTILDSAQRFYRAEVYFAGP